MYRLPRNLAKKNPFVCPEINNFQILKIEEFLDTDHSSRKDSVGIPLLPRGLRSAALWLAEEDLNHCVVYGNFRRGMQGMRAGTVNLLHVESTELCSDRFSAEHARERTTLSSGA